MISALQNIQRERGLSDEAMADLLEYDRRTWNFIRRRAYPASLRQLALKLLHELAIAQEYPYLARLANEYLTEHNAQRRKRKQSSDVA